MVSNNIAGLVTFWIGKASVAGIRNCKGLPGVNLIVVLGSEKASDFAHLEANFIRKYGVMP